MPDPNTVQDPNGTPPPPGDDDGGGGTRTLRFAFFAGANSPLGRLGSELRIAFSDRQDYCQLLEDGQRAADSAVLNVTVRTQQRLEAGARFDSSETRAILDTYDDKCKHEDVRQDPSTVNLMRIDDSAATGQVSLQGSAAQVSFTAVRCEALLTNARTGGKCLR